jgi:hypothetical protein
MRPTHRSSDFIAPERQGFALSVDDAKRVDEIVAALSDHVARGLTTTLNPC